MANFAAMKSKDESTHCGAVIVDNMNHVVATGYNSFVRGINDNVPARQKRPYKYLWFEHGERNAIYSAANKGDSTRGCRMYVTGIPCADCARGIIQAGIKKVIIQDRPEFGKEWEESCKVTLQMFKEAGVELIKMKEPIIREIYKFTRGEKH
jgi:dCMP deaminase